MKTRNRDNSSKVGKEKVGAPEVPRNGSSCTQQFVAEDLNPPTIFVLPRNASDEARILTLQDPRYARPKRYYVCPKKGFYEIRNVSGSKGAPRSCLLSASPRSDARPRNCDSLSNGYVLRSDEVHIATAVDPVFLLLPVLCPASSTRTSASATELFLAFDDFWDQLVAVSPHLEYLSTHAAFLQILERRAKVVCDTVEAGDNCMYRLSNGKLLRELLRKANCMVQHGLPASMEAKLVRKVLEPPMLGIRREETLRSEESPTETMINSKPMADSQDSVGSSFTSVSNGTTAATTPSQTSIAHTDPATNDLMRANAAPDHVVRLLRLRTAMDFLCASYLPPHISQTIKGGLQSSTSGIDFTPLDDHLAHLADLRKQAQVARSASDFSRKRSTNEEEDADMQAEKRRKMEEEERKKKAGESRGVKALKKVNVTGMKKMSDFFKKK